MNKSFYILIILALLLQSGLVLLPGASAQEAHQGSQAPSDAILYVKPGGTGDCSSWAKACELQTALSAAASGDEIWVAAGTYKPGIIRDDTFQLVSGAALYGGFTGSETAREDRNWESNLTVLSGDIGVEVDSSDNSYHVVTGSGVTTTAVLDGFTITAGQADGYYSAPCGPQCGGGMYNDNGNPSLRNVVFSGNSAIYEGGGMFNHRSNPALTNVVFSGNSASSYGGGMYNYDCSPALTKVVFSGNSVDDYGGGMYSHISNPALTNVVFSSNLANYGGGMYNDISTPALTNVAFSGNSAIYEGGGMFNRSSSPALTNVVFSGNSADYGGGMYNKYSSSPMIANTILWGNTAGTSGPQISNDDLDSTPSIQYSDVQGGCATIAGNDCSGGGNIDADPLFVRNPHPGADDTWSTEDDDYGDLRLQLTSPAIDAGNNAAVPSGVTTDLLGNPRFFDIASVPDTGSGTAPIVDMGAYEVQLLVVYLPLTMK